MGLEEIVEDKGLLRKTKQSLSGVVNTCWDWATKYRFFSSVVAGTAVCSSLYFSFNSLDAYLINVKNPLIGFSESFMHVLKKETFWDYLSDRYFIGSVYFGAAAAWFTNRTLKIRRYLKELGVTQRRRLVRESAEEEKTGLKEKMRYYLRHPQDFVIEHPLLPSLAFVGFNMSRYADRYINILQRPVQLTLANLGLNILWGAAFYVFLRYGCVPLHSKSKGFIHLAAAEVASSIFKKYNFAIEECNKGLKQNPSGSLMMTKGKALMRAGHFEEGLEQYREGMDNLKITPLFMHTAFSRYDSHSAIAESCNQIERNKEDVFSYINLATALFELNYPEKSVEVLERLIATHPQSLDLRCFSADFLDMIGEKNKAEEYLRETASLVAKDKSLMRESIGESKNTVFIVGPSRFVKRAFVFKEGDLEDLQGEARTINELKEIIAGNDKFIIPTSLGIVNYDHTFSHAIKRVYGELLTDRIKRKDQHLEQNVLGILEFLGLIEGKFPIEKNPKGRVVLNEDLEEKLMQLTLHQDLVRSILIDSEPVFYILNNSIYVFDKDPHPDNWEILEKSEQHAIDERIVVLDCETKKFKPLPIQIAKLLGNLSFYRDKNRELINKHAAFYNDSAREFNKQNFFSEKALVLDPDFLQLSYLNSVIYTAFDLFAVLADKHTKQEERLEWIDLGIDAIQHIATEFSEYYFSHKQNYINLVEDLNALKAKAA
jgi:tetratricopeptide (TPR) repeat protein